ncbi:MAG: HDOD domain-containing protein [Woeseiaceae bacterium]
MENSDQFRFVSLLALELENGDISLPSLPDVVLKIRKLLESDNCDFERVSRAVSVDPVLVSRLFVYANSAYYNRANIKIDTLDAAIGRLGFEVVRNAAMSLAMKQLYSSDKNNKMAHHLRAVWARGMKLSCMAYALAKTHGNLNHESAYLCGLMHEIGKLYILTKADDFPEFLGNSESLKSVMEEWNPQISKSIIESWGFPDEVAESTDPVSYVDDDADSTAKLVDVMVVAKLLVDGNEEKLAELFEEDPSCIRLGISENVAADVMLAYREKLNSMQQSLA